MEQTRQKDFIDLEMLPIKLAGLDIIIDNMFQAKLDINSLTKEQLEGLNYILTTSINDMKQEAQELLNIAYKSRKANK